jgi:hypothetical protein
MIPFNQQFVDVLNMDIGGGIPSPLLELVVRWSTERCLGPADAELLNSLVLPRHVRVEPTLVRGIPRTAVIWDKNRPLSAEILAATSFAEFLTDTQARRETDKSCLVVKICPECCHLYIQASAGRSKLACSINCKLRIWRRDRGTKRTNKLRAARPVEQLSPA